MAQSKSGLNWGLPDSPLPTTAAPTTGTIPTAAPAGATATTTTPAPAAPTPSANDFILQHLGQGGIGSADRVAPQRPDSWWDVVPGTKGFGEPAQPGPQSWFDWFSKTYHPSAADVGTAYGDDWSYGLSPLAAKGVQVGANAVQTANPLPASLTPEAMRARIQQAHENVGPGEIPISAAAMATQPLTYFGLNPISAKIGAGVGALAEKYLPAALAKYVAPAVTGGTATGLVSEAHTAGQGGGPMDYLRAAANIPVGAALSAGASSLPLGQTTAQDIIDKTGQAAGEATSQVSNIKVPSKDLGFKVEGQTDPSVLDLQGYKDWLSSQGVKSAPVNAPLKAASANANYTGPTDLYGEGNQGYRQWLKNQSVSNPSGYSPPHNLPSAAERMMDSINQQLGKPELQSALTTEQTAQQRADFAKKLADWSDLQGQAGVNVPAEAATAAQTFPIGSPQRNALKGIGGAQAPPAGPVPLPKLFRNLITGTGAVAGELGSSFGLGHSGGAGPGAVAANYFADAIESARTPQPLSALVQQNIAKAYPPTTGQPAPGPGGNQALSNALLRLYGAGWFH